MYPIKGFQELKPFSKRCVNFCQAYIVVITSKLLDISVWKMMSVTKNEKGKRNLLLGKYSTFVCSIIYSYWKCYFLIIQ